MVDVQKILKAKANTLIRANNTIYAKISDAEDSGWRCAFGVKYTNTFINICKQATDFEILTKEETLKEEKVVEEEKKVELPRRKRCIKKPAKVDEVANGEEKESN